MPKHSFLDSILNRPSQSYTEPTPGSQKYSGSSQAAWQAPSDLPNAAGGPQSILSGNLFSSKGKGSLAKCSASNAPSVFSMSTTSRFSRFRSKGRRPSIYGGSIFGDGNSTVAPTETGTINKSPRKSRWWESGSIKFGRSSRPPSIAGSTFSEPEAPQGLTSQSLAGIGSSAMPPRGAMSDFGDTSRHRSSRQQPPPMPSIASKASLNSMRLQSGVAPLSQPTPSLVKRPSRSNVNKGLVQQPYRPFSPTPSDPFRPVSPAASMGRSHSRTGNAGSQDWNTFVSSMSGTEVAKTWESMPTLVPKPSNPSFAQGQAAVQRRPSLAERVQKELQQEAQFEQVQLDPGVARQDLLTRAASQVIGDVPPQMLPTNIQPGQVIAPLAHSRRSMSEDGHHAPRSPVTQSQAYPSAAPAPVSTPIQVQVPYAPVAVPAVRAAPVSGPNQVSQPAHQPPVQMPVTEEEEEEEGETEESEESSSDEVIGITQSQSLDVVAEEEETCSNGHSRHHEMRPQGPIKGKGINWRHSEYDQVMQHRRSRSNIAREVEQPSTDITSRIAVSEARSLSPPQPSPPATDSQAESPLSKQPGEETDFTFSALPPSVAPAANKVKTKPATKAPLQRVPAGEVHDSESEDEESELHNDDTFKELPPPPIEELKQSKENLAPASSRPALVTRFSSTSDYKSATSGRSTPTTKGVTLNGNASQDEAVDGDADVASLSDSTTTGSIATSQRPASIKSSRSSRPATLSRRLSDISLGTSFGMSGVLGRSGRTSSCRVKMADDDSDSPADHSDDDAELKARAREEQDRLRKMNVGDDFFGGSLASILDSFDRKNWSDSTINRLGLEDKAPSTRRSDTASIREAIAAHAQETINEVRQKRAEKGVDEDGKTRASSAGGLAPSFAAMWLLNQAAAAEEAGEKGLEEKTKRAGTTITPSTSANNFFSSVQLPASKYASLFSSSPPPAMPASTSVLDRPRPKASKPSEMGGLVISEGKLRAEVPAPPPEDTRSTLPIPLSTRSVSGQPAPESPPRPQPTVIGTASKDKPPPAKSAMKSLKHSKSLADTLFSFSTKSSEAKAEKKEKARRKSNDSERSPAFSLGSSKEKKAERKSREKARKSIESNSRTSMVSERLQGYSSDAASKASMERVSRPAALEQSPPVPTQPVPEALALSEKVAGKRAERHIEEEDEEASSELRAITEIQPAVPKSATRFELAREIPPPSSANVRASESVVQFSTPFQSMANIASTPGSVTITEATPPQKFHTARDLKAMADPQKSPTPAIPTRSTSQNRLSQQLKSMDGFSSFSLPAFDVRPNEFDKDAQAEAANEVGADIVGSQGAALAAADMQPTSSADDKSMRTITTRDLAQSDEVLPPESHMSRAGHRDSLGSDELDEPVRRPSFDASAISTAMTTPVTSDIAPKPMMTRSPVISEFDVADAQEDEESILSKKLPMPPFPATADMIKVSSDDKTPTGNPTAILRFGVNLIPPTPLATENRNSFTGSQAPTTPTVLEEDPMESAQPQRPPLMSRSSSQRTTKQVDAGTNGQPAMARSKSVSTRKKQLWQEYTGKGLSLPPGLVATTVASSTSRRGSLLSQSTLQEALPKSASEADLTRKKSKKRASGIHTMPAASVTKGTLPPILEPDAALQVQTQMRQQTAPPLSPKSKKRRDSSGSISPSSSMNRLAVNAPPVPQIPDNFHPAYSGLSSPSRLYAGYEPQQSSAPSSSADSEAGSISPAPSNVPSQSGRSNVSYVSSSLHSNSHKSSPRPEYSYVNHELTPYARKLRSLSPGPASPAGPQRQSLMSSIGEWESQVPGDLAERPISPAMSGSLSPRFPPLPASTISRTNSVISSVTSPSVVRNAPLGASTNQYLHPPVPRSHMTVEEKAAMSADGHSPPFHGYNGSVASSINSRPSASQSNASLPNTTMPTVPTSYRPNKDPKRFSTVDDLLYTRTTMQTIAVLSGAFASRNKSVARRKSSLDSSSDKRTSMDVPEHLQDELNLTALSLTAHTPPPRKITSTQVLVQIIAVAIDDMDQLLLRERVRSGDAFGYVPGRGFCGRIVECGYEVKKMRKGDIVFGLQESRKCGALAEFMTINHNLICHAPSECLTTEQIAALPSAGVMAHQILSNHCSQLARGARVLILNAHDGIGLLTMQESIGLGLIIVAQCPPNVSDGVAVCQANGAHEVVIGEPLWAINSLHESSFDLVVDTVGGRRIYDAARRVLAFEGQFTTCFGDEHSTANPNLKSHFRSLRRAFFKKDKKNIGYEWVGADTGEDCREALEAVKRAAEQGNICPRLRSVLPLSDAPRAFDPTTRNLDEEPGAIVVRVS